MVRGRPFQPGCKPGPGRPKRRAEVKGYRDAVRSVLTPEALAKLLKKLLDRGMEPYSPGSARCAELVIKVALGNDPCGVLVDELEEVELEEVEGELLARQERQRRQEQALPAPGAQGGNGERHGAATGGEAGGLGGGRRWQTPRAGACSGSRSGRSRTE